MKGSWIALFCYVVLAVISFYPVSAHIDRYALAHPAASAHAVAMYSIDGYLENMGRDPPAYLDVWAYPYGGIAKPLAIPALAAGSVLCKMMSPRTAFNVILLANLVISGLVFYFVGKRLRFGTSAAIGLGGLVVFHPLLQSYILRGQIENTMLWTVGLSLLAGISLLTEERWNVWFFAGACLLPLLIVFSTPGDAVFYVLLCPLVLLYVLLDDGLPWKPCLVLSYIAAFIIAALLLGSALRFYSPDPNPTGEIIALTSGFPDIGLKGTFRTASWVDLVQPSGLLHHGKPFLGLAFMAAVSWGTIAGLRDRRRRWKILVALAGTVGFAVFAMGRMPGGISLPATVVDGLWPALGSASMQARALPFMALCGALALADSLSVRRSHRSVGMLAGLMTLIIADGLLVNPLADRTRGDFYLDERIDMNRVIFALPQRHVADLPIVDLPPHRRNTPERWAAYAYDQSEHGQKIVWCEVPPPEPPPMMRLATRLFESAASYAQDAAACPGALNQLRQAKIGLIVLHKNLVEDAAMIPPLESLLDSWFPRRDQSDSTIVWQVSR